MGLQNEEWLLRIRIKLHIKNLLFLSCPQIGYSLAVGANLKMTEISIPYHLLLPSILSALFLILIVIKRKRLLIENRKKWIWISLTIFLAAYLFIVGSATINDIYYQWDLNNFDLDKDGIFSGQEKTAKQEQAMFKLSNDVGRNFSFITGLMFAFILAVITYVTGQIIELNKRKNKGSAQHFSQYQSIMGLTLN